MSDLRALLHGAAPDPGEPDLAAVHARAADLQRTRRRLLGATAVAAVAAVLATVVLTLPGHDAEDVLTPAATPPPPTRTLPAPSSSPSPAAPPRSAPAFAADTRPDTGTGTGRLLTVTGVRVGRQDGYDRVVLDLAGDPGATPGWRVEYVDVPLADASGARLDVAGAAYLRVVVTGLDLTDPAAQQLAYRGGPVRATGLVREVVPAGASEGRASFVLGTAGRTPFRVFALTGPSRLVVDVRP